MKPDLARLRELHKQAISHDATYAEIKAWTVAIDESFPALLSYVEAMEKDVKRYAWLRDEESDKVMDIRLCIFDDANVMRHAEDFDAAIDQAMEANDER